MTNIVQAKRLRKCGFQQRHRSLAWEGDIDYASDTYMPTDGEIIEWLKPHMVQLFPALSYSGNCQTGNWGLLLTSGQLVHHKDLTEVLVMAVEVLKTSNVKVNVKTERGNVRGINWE